MNFLALSQLIASALLIITKAKHGSFEDEVITQVKSGLEQLANYYKQQHEDQQKSQQSQETQGELQNAAS